jgi:hypothetical protein
MKDKLYFGELIQALRKDMEAFPDHRSGHNRQYEVADAGMAAFSVFFTQSASFLDHQRTINLLKGRSNVQSLFLNQKIPSDNQIRTLLDGVAPSALSQTWARMFHELEASQLLDQYRDGKGRLLIAIDGTEYFCSQQIHCQNCSHRERANGKTEYFHSVLTPVIVHYEQSQVIALEPEFICPQDGHDKQDCEINAAKRWLKKHAETIRHHDVVLLGDDLYSREPFCGETMAQGCHFVLVCKPDSHAYLYESVSFMRANGLVETHAERKWNGTFGEISHYQFISQLPLNGQADSPKVNWVQIEVRREDTDALLYKNAFVTDLELTVENIEEIVHVGRARWKVENENNNILKNHGYHLEHNFGHGSQHLSSILLSLNLLAFLFHTLADLLDERYRKIREIIGKRTKFFMHIEVLMNYHIFESWDELFAFMLEGLQPYKP